MHARRRKVSESETFTVVVDDQTAPPAATYVEKDKYPTSWKFQLGQQLQQISTKVSNVVAPNPVAPPPAAPPRTASSSRLAQLEDDKQKPSVPVGASRDRTHEFQSVVRSLVSSNLKRMVNTREPRRAKANPGYFEFMSLAEAVGKNITHTNVKLDKLLLLVREKSLFDDRSAEIEQLIYIIKNDLGALNQQIARLQEVSKAQRRGGGRQLQKHSINVVVALQSKLASTSNHFKDVLELRTENLKQQKQRREEYGGAAPATRSLMADASLLLEEESTAANSMYGDRQPLLPHGGQQQMMSRYDQADLQQRANSMQNIESTIVELGGIFQQLATLVKEQEEIVERIDSNVIDTGLNVDLAHTEILKYFQSVTRNRALMIKIFIVLIVFFIFFYIVMS